MLGLLSWHFSDLTDSREGHYSYARKISRLDSTRSIRGRMPSSLEMASDSSNRDMAFSGSPGLVYIGSIQALRISRLDSTRSTKGRMPPSQSLG